MSDQDGEGAAESGAGGLERSAVIAASVLVIVGLVAMAVFEHRATVILSIGFWFSLAFATGVILRAMCSARGRLALALAVAAIAFILTPLHGPFMLPAALVLVVGLADALWRTGPPSPTA
ncbi:MAG TPA: hypothetical protein PKE32_09740 [Miltoncostaeaceae bacterium]|nr:hypothetical protein [Miltoncostaeaceae bacterium]